MERHRSAYLFPLYSHVWQQTTVNILPYMFLKVFNLNSLGVIAPDFQEEDRFVLLHTSACWQYNFFSKNAFMKHFRFRKAKKYENIQLYVMMCHKNCKQDNFEEIIAKIEPLPSLIYQFDTITQPNPFFAQNQCQDQFLFCSGS